MARTAAADNRVPARERLLKAAATLFYREGCSVGIERVISEAGVAKATFYDCFKSKDELIRCYVIERDDARRSRFASGLANFKSPRAKLLGMFEILGETSREPWFKGCPIIKATMEAGSESPIKSACDDARSWLKDLFRSLADEAGVSEANVLAEELMVIYDGASLACELDHNLSAPATARRMAEALLSAALASSRRSKRAAVFPLAAQRVRRLK